MHSKMSKLRAELCKIIEPNNEFLNGLLSKDVLTDEDVEEIRSERTVYKKNDRLLGYILNNDRGDYGALTPVLTDSGQQHVVNFIQSDGGESILLIDVIIHSVIYICIILYVSDALITRTLVV